MTRHVFMRYAGALLLCLAALVPWWLAARSGVPSSLMLLLAAVVIATRFGGLGPGLLVALVSTLASLSMLTDDFSTTTLHAVAGTELFCYVGVAFFVSWLLQDARSTLQHQIGLIAAMTRDPESGIFAVDRRGHLQYVNNAAESMLGWNDLDMRGRSFHDLVHTCDGITRDRTCPLLIPPLPSVAVSEEELELKRIDGSTLPVSTTISPIIADERISGCVISFRDIGARKRAEDALRRSEERYRTLVDTSPDSILLTDMFSYIAVANRRAAALYGYDDRAELVGVGALELLVPEDRPRAVRDKRNTIKEGSLHSLQYTALRKDGTTFPVELSSSVIMDEDRKPAAIIMVGRDITQRRTAEATLRASETREATQHAASLALAESTTFGEVAGKLLETICKSDNWHMGVFWLHDQSRDVLTCKALWHAQDVRAPRFSHLTRELTFGRGDDLPGRAWETGNPVWVTDAVTDPAFSRALMASQGNLHSAVCVPIRIAGSVQGVMEFFSRDVRPYDDDLIRMLSTISTQIGQFLERKHAEQALEYQAMHDALTDLPNRTLLYRRLQRALRSAGIANGTLALLLLDLDRFKEVNDTLGHHCGDLLLQEVSTRLRYVLRESDTVARLGGDEFAVLLPSTDEIGAEVVASAILTALAQPVVVEHHALDIGTSIGIALYPDHGADVDTLIQRADIAMYAAKRAKSGHAVYAPEFDQHSPGRLAIIGELRQAIDRGLLLLHFQPKYEMRSGSLHGVEALVRWNHPDQDLVPPDEFIPLAEQTGLIGPLALWVLNTALRECRQWHEDGHNLGVAVNLSAQNLHDPELVETITRLLTAWRVRPEWLEIEITESAIMVDSTRALATLTQLHNMGVRISIDDFGTGYSSLAYLKRLPVDEIKIDKSFVLDMVSSDNDAFIARTIIDLGHNMGLRVVAEGVQSQEIWERLFAMGCDMAQGHYLGLPQPASDITRRLRGDFITGDLEIDESETTRPAG
ncbi:MAG TPA: EAL domain-containing protein [Chloroflexota bacterium]